MVIKVSKNNILEALSEHFEWVFNVLAISDVQIPIHVFLVNTVPMR